MTTHLIKIDSYASISTPEAKVWERSDINKLLELYKFHDELYNPNIEKYRDKEAKKIGWETIASELQCKSEEIKKKIHNLRAQLGQQMKLVGKSKKDGDDPVYLPKWPYYSKMTFLLPFITQHSAYSNDTKKSVIVSPNISEEESTESTPKKKIVLPSSKVLEEESTEPTPKRRVVLASPKVLEEESIEAAPKRVKIIEDSQEKEYAMEAVRILENSRDESEIFGMFVGSELRQLKSTLIRKWAKRRIQKILLEASVQDDEL